MLKTISKVCFVVKKIILCLLYKFKVLKQLQKQFEGKGEVKGYNFNMLIKEPHGYIYKVTSDDTNTEHFEVFRHKENTRFNNVRYPRANHFGIWAKTTKTFNRALEILESYDKV